MKESSSKLLATLFAENEILSISELTERVKATLEIEFFALHLQGEVSNYKRHTSDHWYFTLKDANAQLRAVFFKQWNRLLRFEPENGLEVRVRGRLTVYEPRGDYQIVVETLEPVGIGTLQLAFAQQVKKLATEGLFDEARKRPLVAYPRRIGIVTSPVGAALHDMLQILARRNPGLDIVIAPVRVQGNGAAAEIADAIKLLNRQAKQPGYPIDAIIVGRGGGSAEDLWAFNEEAVARAIFQSAIPVVSAIGHETDVTIADLVADLRAPTPSAAAELVAPDASAIARKLHDVSDNLALAIRIDLLRRQTTLERMLARRGFTEMAQTVLALSAQRRRLDTQAEQALQQTLQQRRWQLRDLQQRLNATNFRAPLMAQQAQLTQLQQRLQTAWQQQIARAQRRFAVNAGKLDTLSPLAVLGRGYALVKDERGKLIAQAAQVRGGENLRVRFADGEIRCRVTEPNEAASESTLT